jgi:hypothetical protein
MTFSDPLPDLACPFTRQTFDLLEQLHTELTTNFYLAHQDEFETHVVEPFQRVMRQVAGQLPEAIRRVMDTEKRIFSRFTKKDTDQELAWDFYWGAFYPRSGVQCEDVQLSLWLNYRRFEIGFYIGSYGTEARRRFENNCKLYGRYLHDLFDPLLVEGSILLGTHDNVEIDSNGALVIKKRVSWEEWLNESAQTAYDVSLVLPKDQVLKLSEAKLVSMIVQAYQKLFPLVLIAILTDPIPSIAEYVGQGNA